MKLPASLLEDVCDHRLIPFVGSGVSLTVQPGLLPTWPELLGKLGERLRADGRDDDAELVRLQTKRGKLLDAAASAWEDLKPAGFYQVLRDAIDRPRPTDAAADWSLPQAVWALQPPIIVTTNYDNVLQWTCPHRQVRTLLNRQRPELANLYRDARPDRPTVWHLHGHIHDAESLILAPLQYDAFYRSAADQESVSAAALQQLQNAVANYTFLFVGFGLRDRYVMDLLSDVLAHFGDNLQASFALLKKGEADAERLWRAHSIRVLEFDEYGPPLVACVQDIAAQAAAHSDRSAAGAAAPVRRPLIPQPYLRWLQRQCLDIDVMGMRRKDDAILTLRHVYVPLTTAAAPEEARRGKKGKRGRRAELPPGEGEAKPQLLLDLLARRSLYVTGDPGSGKSTFCRWVSYLAATRAVPPALVAPPDEYRESLPDDFRRRLPLLIRLREFWPYLPERSDPADGSRAALEQALAAWLAAAQPDGIGWADVVAHLAAGSLLLLLDGVDEVPPSRSRDGERWSPRGLLVSGLSQALPDWERAGNRVLLTGRPYGLDADQVRRLQERGLHPAPVARLEPPLQELLAARWFGAAAGGDAAAGQAGAAALLAHVRPMAGLEPLAANPMLLTAMCIIYQEGRRLPQDKYELYDRIVDTVLYRRCETHSNEVELVRERLAAVALNMHTGEALGESRATPQAEVNVAQLDAILQVYRDITPETEAKHKDIVQTREGLLSQSGLLLPKEGQRESKQAVFYHLSLQEFLAAERLSKLHPAVDALVALYVHRAGQPAWRNTLSFVFARLVSQISWQSGVSLLERLLDELTGSGVVFGQPGLPRDSSLPENDSRPPWAITGSGVVFGQPGLPRDSSLPENDSRPPWALGLALAAADGLSILLGRELELRDDLKDRFRQLCLAAIDQEVDVLPRVEFAHLLGRLGDPRIVQNLREHPDDPRAWVAVPAGRYKVGGGGSWYGLDPLEEQRFETRTPLRIARYPVTNSQFRVFVDAGGYADPQWWSDAGWQWRQQNNVTEPRYWQDTKWNGLTQPVVGVSFYEAEAFCRWAGVRLPTEREWEAAARGPNAYAYPWGNDWRDGVCNTAELNLQRTTPVGIFPRSRSQPFGLEDAAGNVWEWCTDEEKIENYGVVRVVRGGSWDVRHDNARCAFRFRWLPDNRLNLLGFRVCGVVSPGLVC